MATGATPRELLQRIWLFSELAGSELDELSCAVHTRSVAEGCAIVRQGDTDADLYAIVQGLVRVSVCASDGREFALQLLGPGQVFGELALVDGLARSATVTAVRRTELLRVSRAELLALLERRPPLALKLMVALAAQVRRLTMRSEELSALPVSARMARRLLEIADLCGTRLSSNSVALPIALSQQDLAEHVQATRESVNKCLAGWMRDGIVQRTHSQLVICDRERLTKLTLA